MYFVCKLVQTGCVKEYIAMFKVTNWKQVEYLESLPMTQVVMCVNNVSHKLEHIVQWFQV